MTTKMMHIKCKVSSRRGGFHLHGDAVAAVVFHAHLPLHKAAVPLHNVTAFHTVVSVVNAQAPARAAAAHASERSQVSRVLLFEALQRHERLGTVTRAAAARRAAYIVLRCGEHESGQATGAAAGKCHVVEVGGCRHRG